MSTNNPEIKKKPLNEKKLEQEYQAYSDEELEELALQLVSNFKDKNFQDNNRQLLDNEIRIKILKKVIDQRQYDNPIQLPNILYPDIRDPNFNTKIYQNSDFYQSRIELNPDDFDTLIEQGCDTNKFNLLPNQIFLKNFISTNTPYNGILIYHGTGVGKTCSAVTIAEQFKHIVNQNKNKIFVLLSQNIKDSFIKNISDPNKIIRDKKFKRIKSLQCTGYRYLEELGDIGNHLLQQNQTEKLSNKIKKLIKQYYKFMGYVEFANHVQRMLRNVCEDKPENTHMYVKKMLRKKLFSNSVIIIDEVHHIRDNDTNKENIRVGEVLKEILRDADNIKLILLSATPMYNVSTEIIGLLNLLLINDKRPEIKESDVFNKDGTMTVEGRNNLIKYARGYISFLRGENPFEFPNKIYPDINEDPNYLPIDKIPHKLFNGQIIPQEERIKYLKLVKSQLISYQNNYNINYMKTNSLSDISESALDEGIKYSNIVYPGMIDFDLKSIDSTFDGNDNVGYTYKSSILDKYGEFLHIDKLKEFSAKYYNIIKYIENSTGIIYVYSRYIYDGILPLALALEQNGYSKYNSKPLLHNDNKIEPIKGNYIMITGNKSLTPNRDKDVQACISDDNKYGEKIKIILGTQASGEGIDFSNIREVHILESWFHLNTLGQAVGRGVRYCSHKNLPLNERNVTVYYHVSTLNEEHSDIETFDIYRYRLSENKAIKMAHVERLLKQIAIDCYLNKQGNIYLKSIWNKVITITTSQNITAQLDLGDQEYSQICNFQQCDYNCEPFDPNIDSNITDTYNIIEQESINKVIKCLEELYKKDTIYDIQQIYDFVNRKYNISEKMLYIILSKIINNPQINIKHENNDGFLIYVNIYYIWQPKDYDYLISSSNRKIKPQIKKIKFSLENSVKENIQQKIVNNPKNMSKKIENLIKLTKKILELNIDLDLKYCLIRFEIDNLNESELINLLSLYVINYNNPDLKNIDVNEDEFLHLNNILDDRLLFKNRDKYFGKEKYKEDKSIFGFITINKNQEEIYYCIDKDTIKKCNSIDKTNITTSRKLYFHKTNINKNITSNKFYGFIQRGENKNIFKIVNNNYGISSGKNCTSINLIDNVKNILIDAYKNNHTINNISKSKDLIVDEIIKNIHIDQLPKINRKTTKPNLCHCLNIVLRYNDRIDSNKRWFYNELEYLQK